MRMTIYAALAVAVGIALVGVLPTQLAAVTNLRGGRDFTLQTTGQGNETSGSNLQGQPAKTESETGEEPGSFDVVGSTAAERAQEEFNANVKYYGLWAVNLLLALGVYFLAKRRLG